MKFTKEERMKYIGSSDIAAVLGLSRWKTPLKLWAEKTGEVDPDDLSDNQAVEWGTRLEEVVSKKFSEKHDCKLIAYKKRYTHKKYPFISCELDRLIAGTDELVEIKTCNAWSYKAWDGDEIPQDYILQVMLALGLSGRNVGHFAVLVGGQKYIERKITFDQKLYDSMIEKAAHFWSYHIKKKIAPMAMADDNSDMINFFPEDKTDKIVSANQEIEQRIALRQELAMHIKEQIKEKAEIEAKLKQIIGEATGLETEKYKATWKKQNMRPNFDTELMQENGHYELYVKPNSGRVLRISKKKEAK